MPAKEFTAYREDPRTAEALERLAAKKGVDKSALLRKATAELLEQEGESTELPPLPWKWCAADFVLFCEGDESIGWAGLPTPDGDPFRLEGHTRLIIEEFFTTGLVELLVLIPKGNYKTTLLAALAVFHLLTVVNANCYIGAADKIQADEMYRFATFFAESDERFEERLLVRRSTREIRSEVDMGFIRVLASDDSKRGGKRQGFNPTLALIDELHAHDNANLYTDMRSGLFKRGGSLITITTAGHDEEESVLGQLRRAFLEDGKVTGGLQVQLDGSVKKSKEGRLTIARTRSGRSAMLEWACTPKDDLSDMRVVKWANPASGVTIESLEDAKEAPGITPWIFARYRANVWTLGYESWVPVEEWDGLALGKFDEDAYDWQTVNRRVCVEAPTRFGLKEGDEIFCAVDMGRYRDSAAVVCVAPRANDRPVAWLSFIERPDGTEKPVGYGPVKQHLRDLDSHYRLLAAGWDPKYFDQAAEELEDEGLLMAKFDQGNERICPAWGNLREAIMSGNLRHDGDPILAAHVKAGKTKDVGDQFKVVKQSRNGPLIDAAVALAMAHQLAFFRPAAPSPFVEVI